MHSLCLCLPTVPTHASVHSTLPTTPASKLPPYAYPHIFLLSTPVPVPAPVPPGLALPPCTSVFMLLLSMLQQSTPLHYYYTTPTSYLTAVGNYVVQVKVFVDPKFQNAHFYLQARPVSRLLLTSSLQVDQSQTLRLYLHHFS